MKNIYKIYFFIFLIFSKGSPSFCDSIRENNSFTENTFENFAIPQKNPHVSELAEAGKILLMSMLIASAHGIIHDSISINVCFDYLGSITNHHGMFMKNYFSTFHKNKSKIGHALVWGIVSTIELGIISGIVWAYMARTNPESLTWKDLLPYALFLSGITLTFSGILAYDTYQKKQDSFASMLTFHKSGYLISGFGALALALFFRFKPKNLFNRVSMDDKGIKIDLDPKN